MMNVCGSSSQTGTGLPPGVTLSPIDGAPPYFASKSAMSAWLDGHVLLGAWLEQPQDATQVGFDVAMGNNIYWNLSGGSTDYATIRAGGMHIQAPSSDATTGSETVGWAGTDEVDMQFGPGWAAWDGMDYNGHNCAGGVGCGYTVNNFFYSGSTGAGVGSAALSYPIDGRQVSQGGGKGVLFWESDAEAQVFMRFSDILSADSYWFTDTDLQVPSQGGCALLPNDQTACISGPGLSVDQSRLAANYEFNVTRLRFLQALNGASKPVVVPVETGCPMSNGLCVTTAQFTAAAWHVLIAGGRGIIWFQHNFSGPCVDFRTFEDGSDPSNAMYGCQITPGETLGDLVRGVTAFNTAVASLNSVLLSPFANGYVTATGKVSVMAKYANNSFYIFAGSGTPGMPPPANQIVSFTLAGSPNGTATVINEGRTISVVSGRFSDTFADSNAVHVYQIQ
jgi:hypothetical protein